MTEDKQIKALKNDLLKSEFWRFDEECNRFELDRTKTARNLHRKGYRKADEVARDIIDLAKCLFCPMCDYDGYEIKKALEEIAKKYTEAANDERRD